MWAIVLFAGSCFGESLRETDRTMDGFWTAVWAVLALSATVFAIRTTVRFDVNEWLRDRRKQREANLRAMCPHVTAFKDEEGRLVVQGTFVSPSGTTAWQCQLCGHVTHDGRLGDERARFYASNPQELVERQKKMEAMAKKLGRSP